jgi:hypothetical protein
MECKYKEKASQYIMYETLVIELRRGALVQL